MNNMSSLLAYGAGGAAIREVGAVVFLRSSDKKNLWEISFHCSQQMSVRGIF